MSGFSSFALTNGTSSQRQRVSYFYDEDVGNYTYGIGHPMKPHRVRMCHSLVTNYGLYKKMDIIRPTRATAYQMTRFHNDEYIDFLSRLTPEMVGGEGMSESTKHLFNLGDDCPVFDGLFEFCTISAGGSIDAAHKLTSGESDIAINWAGGLHHAKKTEASGFCYVNDIVLAILELLRYHQRVLYIDIDIHHGDGVEEAFYTTDRVMTCSFHMTDFFPGTGKLEETGIGKGKNYAVNVPLQKGMDDWSYQNLFEPVIKHIMEWYRPGAVVLQCGADSLAGDKLGCFNLSMKGHANCVAFVKSFNVPTIVVGGGGYTVRNVARAWTFETAVVLNEQLPEELPFNPYFEYYGPEYRLDVPSSNMKNDNTPQDLENLKRTIIENLRHIPFAPSVQMQEVPRDYTPSDDEDEEDADIRIPQRLLDSRVVPESELSDSEDEDGRRNSYDANAAAAGGRGGTPASSGTSGALANRQGGRAGASTSGQAAGSGSYSGQSSRKTTSSDSGVRTAQGDWVKTGKTSQGSAGSSANAAARRGRAVGSTNQKPSLQSQKESYSHSSSVTGNGQASSKGREPMPREPMYRDPQHPHPSHHMQSPHPPHHQHPRESQQQQQQQQQQQAQQAQQHRDHHMHREQQYREHQILREREHDPREQPIHHPQQPLHHRPQGPPSGGAGRGSSDYHGYGVEEMMRYGGGGGGGDHVGYAMPAAVHYGRQQQQPIPPSGQHPPSGHMGHPMHHHSQGPMGPHGQPMGAPHHHMQHPPHPQHMMHPHPSQGPPPPSHHYPGPGGSSRPGSSMSRHGPSGSTGGGPIPMHGGPGYPGGPGAGYGPGGYKDRHDEMKDRKDHYKDSSMDIDDQRMMDNRGPPPPHGGPAPPMGHHGHPPPPPMGMHPSGGGGSVDFGRMMPGGGPGYGHRRGGSHGGSQGDLRGMVGGPGGPPGGPPPGPPGPPGPDGGPYGGWDRERERMERDRHMAYRGPNAP
ncbi:hypothetical protein DFQ27_009802 [Actinomortierella ambigua]|uniref:histone deacetylase n=1 Tax=Actinomortierella ambigua TaxID=1343610 RepID=A0A9P6TWN7_9FUNG|nr:hypothetical protein DFQ27_009802 [Actinomortierella ambigua]